MQVSPTFPTRILTGLALVLLVAALFAVDSVAFAWSIALVLGLATSRVLTQYSVTRARSAGFEMLWQHPQRQVQTVRGRPISLSAELRNRSNELLILESITALCPPELEVEVEPASALLPAHSALPIQVKVRPLRVGLRGIQGLSVVVRSDVSTFEAQLTFANPFLVQVGPNATAYAESQRRGGLGRVSAPAQRTGIVSGESLELRELREHQPGDALRKIAWKASARRGRLLVRDDEREHRHLIWFVLDASVELWAGRPAESVLDEAIDRVASLIRQSLRRGDLVGLCIVAARTLTRIAPDQGSNHERRLFDALNHATMTLDADRSDLDEQDAAAVVLEHLRPMDPQASRRISSKDLDAIARLAQRNLGRSQVPLQPEPAGISPRDRLFRRYLATFGLPSPPRTTTDRDLTDRELIDTLDWLATQRPDRVRVCSPWPHPRLVEGLVKLQRRMKRSRIDLDWIPMNIYYGIGATKLVTHQLVHHSLEWRKRADMVLGRHSLRRLGIREAVNLRTLQSTESSPSK